MRVKPVHLLVAILLVVVLTIAALFIGLLVVAHDNGIPAATPAPTADLGARPASQFLTPPATDPAPVVFPRDDAPHDDLTEWWYYTGHLAATSGAHYGFEFVIFQVRRANLPPVYFSHFAVTDVGRASFHYAEQGQAGAQPTAARVPATLAVGDWRLVEDAGQGDQIKASMPGYALDLRLHATKPPALHNTTGYFEYAPATGSYYYSRTRLETTGTLTVDGQTTQVSGLAWMDHQWGNFLTAGGVGWDWFSIQLADDRDLMLWHTRDRDGRVIYAQATLVAPDGRTTALSDDAFRITPTGTWTSPASGATYPSGWTVDVPGQRLHLTLTPVLRDQELRTPQTTRVTYWEGAIDVTGDCAGQPITGEGYVELTGYAAP